MSDLTVFKPVTGATDTLRTWAASVLADLPVVVKFCEVRCPDKQLTRITTDAGGRHFRKPFHIGVKYGAHFAIRLYREATRADLAIARKMTARLQDGIVCDRLWEERKNREGRYMDSWLPFDPEKRSPELRPCTDTNCRRDWHEWETSGDTYKTEACEHDAIRTDHYTIMLQRHDDDPWTVKSWQTCDQFEGADGIDALPDWANDVAYLQGECDRINAVQVKEAV